LHLKRRTDQHIDLCIRIATSIDGVGARRDNEQIINLIVSICRFLDAGCNWLIIRVDQGDLIVFCGTKRDKIYLLSKAINGDGKIAALTTDLPEVQMPPRGIQASYL